MSVRAAVFEDVRRRSKQLRYKCEQLEGIGANALHEYADLQTAIHENIIFFKIIIYSHTTEKNFMAT